MATRKFNHGDTIIQLEVGPNNECFFSHLIADVNNTPTTYSGSNGAVTVNNRKVVTHCGEATYEADYSELIQDDLGNEYIRLNPVS